MKKVKRTPNLPPPKRKPGKAARELEEIWTVSPYAANPATQAASLKTVDTRSQEERVFNWIEEARGEGRTQHEIAAHFKIDIRAVCRCVTNMMNEGKVRFSKAKTRPGPNGKANAVVLRVPKFSEAKADKRFALLFVDYSLKVQRWEKALKDVQLCRGEARAVMRRIHARIKRFRKEGSL